MDGTSFTLNPRAHEETLRGRVRRGGQRTDRTPPLVWGAGVATRSRVPTPPVRHRARLGVSLLGLPAAEQCSRKNNIYCHCLRLSGEAPTSEITERSRPLELGPGKSTQADVLGVTATAPGSGPAQPDGAERQTRVSGQRLWGKGTGTGRARRNSSCSRRTSAPGWRHGQFSARTRPTHPLSSRHHYLVVPRAFQTRGSRTEVPVLPPSGSPKAPHFHERHHTGA